MRALVTAGGTSEPIDDVRVVTNLSSGRLGAALANALAARDVDVTLLAGRALAAHPEWVGPGVHVEPFGGFVDLRDALARHAAQAPDLVLMAAAVSDFSPVPAAGKISSDQDELVLVMKRNPKLLSTLRAAVGPDAVLVGFKLLSNVPVATLLEVARRQIARDQLDFCVANDLVELRGGQHPLWLVPRDGEPVRLEGDKDVVAAELVARLLGQAPDTLRWLARAVGRPVERVRGAIAVATAHVAVRAPAGSREEARSVLQALLDAGWAGGPFSVELADGDHVIAPAAPARGVPILEGGAQVGVAETDDGRRFALCLDEPHRGRGLGTRAAERLDRLGLRAWARTPEARAWHLERGWCPTDDPDTLEAPSSRADRPLGASVCLFDVAQRRVLVGQRRTGASRGMWAFPGGRREPGEGALAAGLRELAEETGIVVEDPLVQRQLDVFAGEWRVTCSIVPVLVAPDPVDTEEMAASWVPLTGALALRPMTAGTRRVLRELA